MALSSSSRTMLVAPLLAAVVMAACGTSGGPPASSTAAATAGANGQRDRHADRLAGCRGHGDAGSGVESRASVGQPCLPHPGAHLEDFATAHGRSGHAGAQPGG